MCVPDANGLVGDEAAKAVKETAKSGSTTNILCPTSKGGNVDINCHPKTSKITFGELNTQAIDACQDLNLDYARRLTCIENAKLHYLLAKDAGVRDRCAGITEHRRQILCASAVYLYGPEVRSVVGAAAQLPSNELPDWVKALTPLPWHASPWDRLPNPCRPGQGSQRTPGGNGSWSCQPLTSFALPDPDAQPPSATRETTATPESVEGFEDNARKVAAIIANAVAPRAGARLSPQDQKLCETDSNLAVLAMMKGGLTPVPPVCARIVSAARAEFASFARHGFTTGDRNLDGLLSSLGIYYQGAGDIFSADLGTPSPGMLGLEPDLKKH